MRLALVSAALVVCILGTNAQPADAQAPPSRADSAAILLSTAQGLAAAGRDEAADAVYDWILSHFGDTAAAAVVRELRLAQGESLTSSSARTELLVWGTAYGLWAGAAVPGALGADGPEAYGLGLLLGGPVGFLASRAYAHHEPLTVGDARAITLGGSWGTWQGLGWGIALDLGECDLSGIDPVASCNAEDELQARLATALLGGLAGIGAGVAVANSRDVGAGKATLVNFGALWGTGYGFGLATLADLDGEDEQLIGSLVGGNVGLITTAFLAPDMSRSRARLINIAGIAGALAGAGIDLLLQPSNDKVAIGIPMLTGTLGLIAGWHWTEGR